MSIALYVAALLAAGFVVSGVVPRYRGTRDRRERVEAFERQYRAYIEAREQDHQNATYHHYGPPPESEESRRLRAWLVARRSEMQRDAESVGKGVIYVAPPPMLGGGSYKPHYYFSDLFDEQSFTGHSWQFRLDELATILHETERQLRHRRRDLFNPWAWLRLAFERVVGLPRYALRLAGFGTNVTDSTGVKIGTALWSFLVGAAGIGSFILTALR